jgi:flagellar biosynthesis/type III secretory pathway M-ring protein FliF/YscJ
MIEFARLILWWSLHAALWGTEIIGAALLLAWLYYVVILEPRIRRRKQAMPAAQSDQSAPQPTDHSASQH